MSVEGLPISLSSLVYSLGQEKRSCDIFLSISKAASSKYAVIIGGVLGTHATTATLGCSAMGPPDIGECLSVVLVADFSTAIEFAKKKLGGCTGILVLGQRLKFSANNFVYRMSSRK